MAVALLLLAVILAHLLLALAVLAQPHLFLAVALLTLAVVVAVHTTAELEAPAGLAVVAQVALLMVVRELLVQLIPAAVAAGMAVVHPSHLRVLVQQAAPASLSSSTR